MYTLQPLPVHETYTPSNMHQRMTEKIIHNRGIAYLTIRQQHPPPRTIGTFYAVDRS
jgi:hypothetical protein